MTTKKLTLQDCFKYPFAKYRYRETKHHYVEYPSLVNLILSNPNYELQNVIVDSELILRPLSSLTDEEKMKLKAIQLNENDKLVYNVDVIIGRLTEFSDSIYRSHIEAQDYLRSINIDIDGLQEKGVAVYE